MTSSIKLFKTFNEFSDTLVETGTWKGDGIQRALDAGFTKVYSCDVNPEAVEASRQRFKGKQVFIMHDPSTRALPVQLNDINEKSVFFLDGHAMPENETDSHFAEKTLLSGEEGNEEFHSPLLGELEVILAHQVKGHVILIDDRQCFGTWMFHGLQEEDVKSFILSKDDKYTFSYFENVLCCIPEGSAAPKQTFFSRVFSR